MAQGQLTAEERQKILDLARSGMTRNDIARATGRGPASVSRVCTAAGIDFARKDTIVATQARRADNAARRTAFITTLYDRAGEFLDQMTKPHLVFAFGGRDNVYEEHQLDRPPTGDIKNLMQSAGIALQKAIELERVDASDGSTDAKSLLADLGHALGIRPPDA